jgi:hypothetical protein
VGEQPDNAVNYQGSKIWSRDKFYRNPIMSTKTNIPELLETDIGGFKCLRYLDLNGSLGVFGPEEAREPVEEYIRKYQPICQDPDVRALLAITRPEANMNLKMHIVLP